MAAVNSSKIYFLKNAKKTCKPSNHLKTCKPPFRSLSNKRMAQHSELTCSFFILNERVSKCRQVLVYTFFHKQPVYKQLALKRKGFKQL